MAAGRTKGRGGRTGGPEGLEAHQERAEGLGEGGGGRTATNRPRRPAAGAVDFGSLTASPLHLPFVFDENGYGSTHRD